MPSDVGDNIVLDTRRSAPAHEHSVQSHALQMTDSRQQRSHTVSSPRCPTPGAVCQLLPQRARTHA
jgi:hypothetical protein